MAISAADVKKLRDQTGAGMMDCKIALQEANGSFEEATTLLRKKGLASAAKKAGRPTSEGVIGQRLTLDHQRGILVEVNCESDFVARTDDFAQLVSDVLDQIEAAGDGATQAWLDNPDGPIRRRVAATIGKLGENMAVPRFVRYADQGYVGQYIHLGGKLGVQVELGGVTTEQARRDEFVTVVKEVSMQIAAANPTYVTRKDIPVEVLNKERSIYRGQMEHSGKPPQVIDKIVEGKLESYYGQVVLLDQPSIRDPKTTVAAVIAAVGKAVGAEITVNRFARLKVGESVD